ncbi:MAG: dTDP-4-dehydrorhamnose reductase [Armatimonadota bacterium]|nr:MAG: dTDP-4-dehydrorhamnose reductase [Armatimonadota bacterium]
MVAEMTPLSGKSHKVLVTGARGMLGRELCKALSAAHEVRGVDIEDFDLTDAAAARKALAAERPQVVVNCAAWTDVDGCERDPGRAFLHNGWGTWNLAKAAADIGAALVHLSTDFVFDGAKGEPYTEFDLPNPLSAYGASKLAGEEAVRSMVPHHYIVRSAWLFGSHGPNFVRTILETSAEREEIRVVADQFGSPTYTRDLARGLAEIILAGRVVPGTYHMVNSGVCSWAELAAEALRLARRPARVNPVPAAEWPSPAPRPAYSALRSRRLELQGIPGLRDWREALTGYIEESS